MILIPIVSLVFVSLISLLILSNINNLDGFMLYLIKLLIKKETTPSLS